VVKTERENAALYDKLIEAAREQPEEHRKTKRPVCAVSHATSQASTTQLGVYGEPDGLREPGVRGRQKACRRRCVCPKAELSKIDRCSQWGENCADAQVQLGVG
jgi:hypothetical protein